MVTEWGGRSAKPRQKMERFAERTGSVVASSGLAEIR
jgi:hypothetical protein